LADQGLTSLLTLGKDKILPVLPQLIIPIKEALNTKTTEIVVKTLRHLQDLVKSSDVLAESLVPYYRQILPVMNLLKHRNGIKILIYSYIVNIGDKIDYRQKKKDNIGELI